MCCLFTLIPGLRMSDLSGSGINAQEREPVYTAGIIWPSQSLFFRKKAIFPYYMGIVFLSLENSHLI